MDLFISTVILASSLALFCYWFRYGCLLILAAETPRDYSDEVVRSNHLSFPEVRSRLRKGDVSDLEGLRKCLDRDFAIITCLLGNAPTPVAETCFEYTMLRIHYRTMSAWFRMTRSFLVDDAIQALEEMSTVVRHLANAMGEGSLNFASADWAA